MESLALLRVADHSSAVANLRGAACRAWAANPRGDACRAPPSGTLNPPPARARDYRFVRLSISRWRSRRRVSPGGTGTSGSRARSGGPVVDGLGEFMVNSRQTHTHTCTHKTAHTPQNSRWCIHFERVHAKPTSIAAAELRCAPRPARLAPDLSDSQDGWGLEPPQQGVDVALDGAG